MFEDFTAIVRDISHKGHGIVDHPDGRVFYVRGTWPGDEGQFLVPQGAAKYTEAQIKNIISFSSDRVEVKCPHRGINPGDCGGCPWMMASYPSQLEYKRKRLLHMFKKRNFQLELEIDPIIPSESIFDYRNRAQFKTDGKKIGYVSEGSRTLAPIDDCIILNSSLREKFLKIKATLPRHDFEPTDGHPWCFVDLDDELNLDDLKINRRRPFKQGNTEQNVNMQKWVKEKFHSLPRHTPVIDLFCGSGNFTEIISSLGFTNILAVEVQGVALQELMSKQLPGVRILELDMSIQGAWAKIARAQPHAKVILIDPPREGLIKRRGLFKYMDNLEQIFYISCEAETCVRDLQDMTQKGWQLESLTPLDLFPHTPHLELLSSLRKLSKN